MQVVSFEHGGVRLAFRFIPGKAPAVVYLTGFNPDMEGRKSRCVEGAARDRGPASLRFELSCESDLGRIEGALDAMAADSGRERRCG